MQNSVIFMKTLLIPLSLMLVCLGVVSCASNPKTQQPETPETVRVDAPDLEAPEHVPLDEDVIQPETTEADTAETTIKPNKVVRGYPVAHPVEGRPGHVYNPYNQNMVDVTGLDSLSLVADPNDPNPDHKFRVP